MKQHAPAPVLGNFFMVDAIDVARNEISASIINMNHVVSIDQCDLITDDDDEVLVVTLVNNKKIHIVATSLSDNFNFDNNGLLEHLKFMLNEEE